MKLFAAFLFFLMLFNANAAQLVGNPITLCNNGYSPDGSTCISYSAGECTSGYYDLTPSSTSFISPSDTQCSYASYKPRTLPDTLITMLYHGAVIGDEITLCNNGYSTNNTACTTYSRGDCDTGYHKIVTNAASFISPSGVQCTYGGYKARTMPDTTITLEYHGIVLGNEITLCDNGYSTNSTTCTTYAQGTACPTNYYDVKPSTTAFTAKNGSCASNYHQYIAEEPCGFGVSKSTCVSLCDNGKLTTNVGTCGTLCSLGATTLRTGNGVIVPLWSTKQTTPSINVALSGDICYVNLTTEATEETEIYLNYNGTTYHTTK